MHYLLNILYSLNVVRIVTSRSYVVGMVQNGHTVVQIYFILCSSSVYVKVDNCIALH